MSTPVNRRQAKIYAHGMLPCGTNEERKMAQSHGSKPPSDIPESVRKALREPLIGSTGTFPEGQLMPTDEGAIQFRVGEKDGKLILDFGTPVVWLGMTPQQAISLGELMFAKARQIAKKQGQVLTFRV